jgi:hypothetical protein
MIRATTTLLCSLALVLFCAACSVEGGESESGGESPSETCTRVSAVICQKFFECYTPEERAAAMLPATEEECQGQIEGDLECTTQRADNQCAEGETYDPARAADCVVEYEALSCDTVREGITDDVTPSCAEVCQ